MPWHGRSPNPYPEALSPEPSQNLLMSPCTVSALVVVRAQEGINRNETALWRDMLCYLDDAITCYVWYSCGYGRIYFIFYTGGIMVMNKVGV